MKIHKKIGVRLGFGLVLLLSLFGLLFFSHHKAAADSCNFAACSTTDIKNATFEFQDQQHIVGTFNGKQVVFNDKDPGDGQHVYQAQDGAFCNGGDHNKGDITIDGSNWDKLSGGARSITGGLDVDWYDAANLAEHCQNFGNSGQKYPVTISNKSQQAAQTWQWNNDTIVSNDGKLTLSALSSDNRLYGSGTDKCAGGVAILLTAAGSNLGRQYTLLSTSVFGGQDASKDPSLGKYFPTSGKCYIKDSAPVVIGGTFGKATTNTALATSVAAGQSAKTCESNFNSGFEWIMCPALRLADNAAGAFNSFLEKQLCFKTGTDSSTAGGVVCEGKTMLEGTSGNGTKRAWSVFRTLASVVMVVVLLIVIVAEALGGGMLDAYTIKKILPKIIISVIAIQLSWYLLKFVIDLSNDIGYGIRDLMTAPFGGEHQMQLDYLVGSALGTNTTGTNDTFAFFSILAAGIGALAISIPGLCLLALYVILALLTAFVVMVFRKLLIIAFVIISPVVFVLWILPGTEKYFDSWRKNFGKLLMMFPMIMALVAAGRIFAFLTAGGATAGTASFMTPHLAIAHLGPLPVPYFSTIGSFVDLAIIVAAYFGPYFFLPQTFKWGGQALDAAGKGLKAGLEKGSKPATDYLKWRQGLSPWKQARAARKAESERQAHHQFYEGLASGGLRGRYRRARLGGVGEIENERRMRGRIRQQAEQELEKARREDIARATAQLTQRDLAGWSGGNQDEIRRAIIDGRRIHLVERDDAGTIVREEDFDGAEYARTHEHGVRAALDRGVVHGHWREIEDWVQRELGSGDQHRIAEVNDFLQQNAPTIGDSMTHLLKGMGIAAGSKPDSIVKMRQEEIESILGTLSTQAAAGDAQAQQRLEVFLQNYAIAAQDPRLRTQLDQGGARAIKAFVEGGTAAGDSYIRRVNYDPAVADRNGHHLALIDSTVGQDIATDPAHAAHASAGVLSNVIDEDGVIH